MGYKGRYVAVKHKKKGARVGLIIGCILLVLLLAGGAFVLYYYNSILKLVNRAQFEQKEFDQQKIEEILGHSLDETEPTIEDSTEPTVELFDPSKIVMHTMEEDTSYGKTGKIVNILLVGQDGRPGEDSKLSDTIILCSVNKETKTISLISFLRDLYVKLPDFIEENGLRHECGRSRINNAYALGYLWGGDAGAMKMLDDCIYSNFGVQVDRNVEVDFTAFEKVVDSIGGVEIEMNQDEVNYMKQRDGITKKRKKQFKAGKPINLTGYEALCYARMRKSTLQDNDFNRSNRQRIVISKIIDKCRTLSLKELNNLMKTVLPLVTTDMTNEDIGNYAMELLPLIIDLQVNSVQCPVEGAYSGKIVEIGGYEAGVVVPILEKNREVLMAICEDPTEPNG